MFPWHCLQNTIYQGSKVRITSSGCYSKVEEAVHLSAFWIKLISFVCICLCRTCSTSYDPIWLPDSCIASEGATDVGKGRDWKGQIQDQHRACIFQQGQTWNISTKRRSQSRFNSLLIARAFSARCTKFHISNFLLDLFKNARKYTKFWRWMQTVILWYHKGNQSDCMVEVIHAGMSNLSRNSTSHESLQINFQDEQCMYKYTSQSTPRLSILSWNVWSTSAQTMNAVQTAMQRFSNLAGCNLSRKDWFLSEQISRSYLSDHNIYTLVSYLKASSDLTQG